jgi:hypothetical protein
MREKNMNLLSNSLSLGMAIKESKIDLDYLKHLDKILELL